MFLLFGVGVGVRVCFFGGRVRLTTGFFMLDWFEKNAILLKLDPRDRGDTVQSQSSVQRNNFRFG